MAFLRLAIMLLAGLSVVYVCVYLFLLERERERLAEGYQADAAAAERERFVAAGVQTYARRLRPRLAVAVYALPMAALVVYIWVSN